ncbi:dihydroorotate dehydrogenase [PVC group bacterium]|nr:dihydroorotate dehydrogenase [PVC group bacterium]
MMKNFAAAIRANEPITDEYFWMVIETSEKFDLVLPGQFLHILCRAQDVYDPLLRRPFSIYKYKKTDKGTIFEILYKLVGRGTEQMSQLKEDNEIDVMGPVGNAFQYEANIEEKNIALIGGGVGIPPLIFLADFLNQHKNMKPTVFIGGRRKEDLLCRHDVERLECPVFYSTEDGSEGFEGYITDCFKKELNDGQHYDLIYTCGPTVMLKKVQTIALDNGISSQLCLEEQMGCGLGACLSCVVNTEEGIKRVCKDGPVFFGDKLQWDWRGERVNLIDQVREKKAVFKTDLTVDLGKLRLKNPIITASGTFGYGEEFKDIMDLSRLGGIAVKGITLHSRTGNRQQRLAETPAGLLNTIGLQNYGVDEFIKTMLPKVRSYDTAVIVNISGERIEDYGEIAKRLNDAEGVQAIEVNISCPNMDEGCMEFGTDPSTAAKVVDVVRKNTNLFCIVKLSPNVTDITQISRACEDYGIDCFSLVNTFLGMAIDPATAMPVLGQGMGGLSGPAIKPLAVRMVWQLYQATKLPIMGMGGIMNLFDALEFVYAGSKVIALGTVNFIHPNRAMTIIDDLLEYLIKERVNKFEKLVGLSHTLEKAPS